MSRILTQDIWKILHYLDDYDDDDGLIIRVFDYEGYDSDCEWESNRQDNLDPSAPTEQRPTQLLLHYNSYYSALYNKLVPLAPT